MSDLLHIGHETARELAARRFSLDGLTPQESETLRSHLSGCPACKAAYGRLAAAMRAAAHLPAAAAHLPAAAAHGPAAAAHLPAAAAHGPAAVAHLAAGAALGIESEILLQETLARHDASLAALSLLPSVAAQSSATSADAESRPRWLHHFRLRGWGLGLGAAAAAAVLMLVVLPQVRDLGSRVPGDGGVPGDGLVPGDGGAAGGSGAYTRGTGRDSDRVRVRGSVNDLPEAGLGLSGVDEEGSEYEVAESKGVCICDALRFYLTSRDPSLTNYVVFGLQNGKILWYFPEPGETAAYAFPAHTRFPLMLPWETVLASRHEVGPAVAVAVLSDRKLDPETIERALGFADSEMDPEAIERARGLADPELDSEAIKLASAHTDPESIEADLARSLGRGVAVAAVEYNIVSCEVEP